MIERQDRIKPFGMVLRGIRQLGLRSLILTIFAVALVNVTFATAVRWSSPQDDFDILGPPMIRQAAATALLLDGLEPSERLIALGALNSPILLFSLGEDFDATPPVENPAEVFVPVIAAYRAVLEDRPFSVYRRSEEGLGPLRRAALSDELIIVMRLADGSSLIVESGETFRRLVGTYGATLVVAILGVVLIGLMTWASFSYAGPLERLARVSRGFVEGADVTNEFHALPETGPKPVRELAAALNLATTKLVRLTDERTTTLAAIAHDLRTYLTRLRMRSEFVQDDMLREKLARDIEDMAQLVEDSLLLGKSAQQAPAFEPLEISDWLDSFVARRCELGDDVVRQGARQARTLDVAGAHLTRVLNNLVDNALRYAGAAQLDLNTQHPDSIVIDVIDDGPGVPAAFLNQMDVPYTRLETSRSRDTGGAGLGLAIAKALLGQIGGTLTLENRAAGGFRARVTLRVAKDV